MGGPYNAETHRRLPPAITASFMRAYYYLILESRQGGPSIWLLSASKMPRRLKSGILLNSWQVFLSGTKQQQFWLHAK